MTPLRQLVASLGFGILSLPEVVSAQSQRASSDESAEMAQKIQSLLDQVNELRRRLDEQTRVSQQVKSEVDAAATEAASAKSQAAAQPQSQVSEAKGNTDKLHYKGVTVTLGGFLAAESIYRQHDQASDISTSFASIPYANNSVGQTQELRFTARQSRISALVQGSPSPQTRLGFYSELDFQGGAQTANSNESNSYTPRLRHMVR